LIRIRIGAGWSSDPEVRQGLGASALATRREAVRAIVDVLAVEVDGVDIGAGRTEGPLAEGVQGLLRAVDRLAAGADHASVPFEDGAVELVLHRQGGAALLSVATLARPSRVLAHDVEVDLSRLAEAARDAAREFCAQVARVSTLAGALPELRRLLRAAARPAVISPATAPPPSPRVRTRRAPRRRRDAACSFELHDEAGRLATWRGAGPDLASLLVRGRVTVTSPSGAEVLSVEGAPFLLFRDLCAGAARVAAAHGAPVSFDVARPGRRATARVTVDAGGVSVSGAAAVRCDPLAFAQAIAAGAADLCAVIRARAPSQAGNVLLDDLARTASSLLEHVAEAREGDRPSSAPRRVRTPRRRVLPHPLGPGRLRRISFRTLASADVGPPVGEGFFRFGERIVACGQGSTRAFDARTGEVLWVGPGARAACRAGDGLALLRGDELAFVDVASGATASTRPVPVDVDRPHLVPGAAAGAVLVVSGPSVLAFGGGALEPLWSFTSPGAVRVAPLPLPPIVVLASDTGMVHALDASGRVAWRLRGSGPLETAPRGDARGCLLPFRSPTGSTLTCADPATGARLFEASLEFTPTSPPLRFAGRIAVAGRIAGDAVVAALEEDGAPAWTEPSPVGGPPVLAPRPRGLLAKAADGSCAALDRDGRTAWIRTAGDGPAPPGNLPPVAVRGVVAVPAEEVHLLDGATGAPVGRLPAHAPCRLDVDDDLGAWAIDPEGLVTGTRVRGHLSLLGEP
jgi:hypothetical protein